FAFDATPPWNDATLSGLRIRSVRDRSSPGLPKLNRGLKFANTFGVAHQIRLASWFPGLPKLNPGLKFANTFGVAHQIRLASRFPGLPKLNPGLKFANTFGVAHQIR